MASLELVGEARPTRARGAGQGQALRLMAIRQARLESLALSAPCHERMQGEKKDRHCEVHSSRRTDVFHGFIAVAL